MDDFAKKYFPLYADPVTWSGTIVKTWLRFVLFGGTLGWLTFELVTRTTEQGDNQATYGAVFLIFFQIMILYALRRLYLRIVEKDF